MKLWSWNGTLRCLSTEDDNTSSSCLPVCGRISSAIPAAASPMGQLLGLCYFCFAFVLAVRVSVYKPRPASSSLCSSADLEQGPHLRLRGSGTVGLFCHLHQVYYLSRVLQNVEPWAGLCHACLVSVSTSCCVFYTATISSCVFHSDTEFLFLLKWKRNSVEIRSGGGGGTPGGKWKWKSRLQFRLLSRGFFYRGTDE